MTMPSKLYCGEGAFSDNMGAWGIEQEDNDTQYIRADIAEELARALEFILRGPVRSSPMAVQECEQTLARFRAITP